jgi:hypothetical protein
MTTILHGNNEGAKQRRTMRAVQGRVLVVETFDLLAPPAAGVARP